MNELELIQQLRAGDEGAFKSLVANYQDLVYNTALGIVQNSEDAEDVAQEVFIQVYRSIDQFKGDARLSTWIYRITTTKALDHIRSRKRKKRFAFITSLFGPNDELVHEPVDFQHPGVALDRKEQAALLFRMIDQLPENQKVAFTLHKTEELSYQEIADVMQLSVSAVESLLFRARQNLRKLLEKYYQQNNPQDK
ncbi:RNA polymerase subunit sigma-70 [Niastella yeongjuensis]|uniref:RNA polymerase sigma factor n=1 Tax=Niastella yeongjuensis TaxID=354355 RepID=A0A1V9EZ22_9BACT|nr:RNA polymerase sigma factor [Niastella yeongjuensis]OQP51360.1 RNA polymerase subunit sigma-70 [Niastella yeongjuensis]SEP38362.1 RNA polymerase sigma-70 factor, ECF subfamily [Niastella yeongjuensis]